MRGSFSDKAVVKRLRTARKLQSDVVDVVMSGRVGFGKTFGEGALVLDLDDPVAVCGCQHVESVLERGFNRGESLAEIRKLCIGSTAKRG